MSGHKGLGRGAGLRLLFVGGAGDEGISLCVEYKTYMMLSSGILPHSAQLGIQLVLDSCKSCTCKLVQRVVLFPAGDHPPTGQVSCRGTKKGVT